MNNKEKKLLKNAINLGVPLALICGPYMLSLYLMYKWINKDGKFNIIKENE